VLAIVARMLVARHLKTPEDLGPTDGSPKPAAIVSRSQVNCRTRHPLNRSSLAVQTVFC